MTIFEQAVCGFLALAALAVAGAVWAVLFGWEPRRKNPSDSALMLFPPKPINAMSDTELDAALTEALHKDYQGRKHLAKRKEKKS